MEHTISTPPSGSAILAYGKAPRSYAWVRWVALLVGALIVLCLVGVGAILAFGSIELPSERIALVMLRPSEVREKLPPGLMTDLPSPWRSVLETKSSLPVVFGAWMDASDGTHAFAVILRHHAIIPTDRISVHKQGWYTLIADQTEHAIERVYVRDLLRLHGLLDTHDASWAINARELEQVVLDGDSESRPAYIYGTWDGLSGRIHMNPTDSVEEAPLEAPIIVTLGDNRNEATPVIEALARQGVDLNSVLQPPTGLYVSPETSQIKMTWDQSLPDVEQRRILGSFGVAAATPYELPDASVVQELTPILTLIGPRNEGDQYVFSSEGVDAIGQAPASANPACPGTLRLKIEDSTLDSVLSSWNWPKSWKEYVQSVQIRQLTDTVTICING